MIRAALASLRARKVRLFMSTFAIVLGVAFVVGTLIFSSTLNRSFTALFASTVGDVVVAPEGADDAAGFTDVTVPASLVDTLAAAPGVARVDGNVSVQGLYVIGEDGKVVSTAGPPGLGGNYTDAPAAGGDGLTLVAGRAPSGPDEVVMDSSAARKGGYEVGDDVVLLLPRGTESRVTRTLVGLLGFPDGGSLNGATFVAFDTPTAQQLFTDGEDAFNDLWVTAEDGVSQEQLRDAVAPLLPAGVEAVTGDTAADRQADQLLDAIGFLTTFLLVFAGIALVVGSFLIVNTFSMLVAQRSRELALLRALGASRRQVLTSVQLEAFVVGALGATLGLGLGYLLALGLRALFATFGLDLSGQSLVFPVNAVVAAYAVGVLVTMVAAAGPALRSTRIAPVQALRDDVALPESALRTRVLVGAVLGALGLVLLVVGLGDVVEVDTPVWYVGGGVLAVLLGVAAAAPVLAAPVLATATALYRRVFGTVGRLAGENTRRNPRRTAATASALMIGLTLACTMAIVGASAKASVDASVEENFVGDFVINNVFGTGFSPAIADRVADLDGVASVARQRYQFVRTADDDAQGIAGIAPDDVADFGLRILQGADDLRPGTLLVSQGYAEDRGLAVGDDVVLDVPTGELDLRVVGIYEENPLVFFPLVATIADLDAGGYAPSDNLVVVFASPGADRTTLQAGLEDVVAQLPIVTVKDQAAFAAEQREPIDQFVLIIYALLGLALVIAVLGIVNTLALSVVERTREIGMLRALGLSRAQLRRMIALESVAISVLGALLGLVLGTGFGLALMRAVRDEGLEVIAVPGGQFAIFLVLAVLVGVLAAALPARRAGRLDVLGAIASE
ncbi:ABC transporter permease [Nocardioides sp.]|uniref:ABC transporter permease n=1 Tax=Nocardioides sp. TaxID=35761 RepID=UPI0035190E28